MSAESLRGAAGSDGGRAIRLGPTALRILGRRRRWLRWLAIALAGLTVLSAVSLVHHRGTGHPAAPAVVIRRAVRAGGPIGRADVGLAFRDSTTSTAPFGRIEDVIGRVAVRGLRPGESVTSENAVSPVRYYGVAARVPRGMRAVSLDVPTAAAFGGELAPLSRVDVLGAFEVGQDRAAATLLTSGIVLRVGPGRDTAPPAATRQSGVVEVVVAVPADREREVALAQAFGRVFLAVHTLSAEPAPADTPAAISLRRYLNLPLTSPPPILPPPPGWAPPPAGGPGAAGSAAWSRGPASMHSAAAPARSQPSSPAPLWPVEVITGTGERSVEQVPRVDDRREPEAEHIQIGGPR